VGKAESQIWIQKGYRCLQKVQWSEANESSDEEEIVGDDEGEVGGEKEGGVDSVDLLSPWCLRRAEATTEKVEVTAR
jgi:hypothetical protein